MIARVLYSETSRFRALKASQQSPGKIEAVVAKLIMRKELFTISNSGRIATCEVIGSHIVLQEADSIIQHVIKGHLLKSNNGSDMLIVAEMRCIWIGHGQIKTFDTIAPVKVFSTEIIDGGAWPYAIDANHNYYLIREGVICAGLHILHPHEYYRANRYICGRSTTSILAGFGSVTDYYVNGRKTALIFRFVTEENYEYIFRPNSILMIYAGREKILSVSDFIRLMDAAGKFAGFYPMEFVN